MKLTTTSRYGVRAVVDIAIHQSTGPVSIHAISLRQEISIKYLELILNPIKKAGILKSIRGVKGGYLLAKDSSKITPGDIVRTLEGGFEFLNCLNDHKSCKRTCNCATQKLWMKLKKAFDEILDSTTVEELSIQQCELNKLQNSV